MSCLKGSFKSPVIMGAVVPVAYPPTWHRRDSSVALGQHT